MSTLISIIKATDPEIKNRSLDEVCKNMTLNDLVIETIAIEQYRKEETNLYNRVRALFFLYAIHRFYIPYQQKVSTRGLLPYIAHEHLLKRRFEEAIQIFLSIQKEHGANEGISSGLAEAYHQLAFQTLADQVKLSVHSTAGNRWMFRISHPSDQPLRILKVLKEKDENSGLYPCLHETTPVRMDISHSCWSDIFFLGMDYPEGANVLNISIDLCIKDDMGSTPRPPIETWFRVIDEPVIRLSSIDLAASSDITDLSEVFDFAKDYLGLLKAAVIASGIVPPGMEGAGLPLSYLLERMVGKGKGIEIASKVNNIPKGSRLAVSTNLLASLISVCMRATGQTEQITGILQEEERRLVAAKAILGEWLGGSGGGWQDSGGVWPGMKIIQGVESTSNDPEHGVSRGRLLPQHTVLSNTDTLGGDIREKLQDSLVIVHGGMAQDVGPVLEMVTEKYLLRSQKEWTARQSAIHYFDEVVDKLKSGDIKGIAEFTHKNFDGPIQEIIPWATNVYTETIIETVRKEFGENFWGFWMMGGMSGGGMGFIFAPAYKKQAQLRILEIMLAAKKQFEHGIPFAMEPVVYDFKINEYGTKAELLNGIAALMHEDYYTLTLPKTIKKELNELTECQRNELAVLSSTYKNTSHYNGFVNNLFDRMIPQVQGENNHQEVLNNLLLELGFHAAQHQQIKNELKTGKIGLSKNRLPANTSIDDVLSEELAEQTAITTEEYHEIGLQALKNKELAIVTLAGGAGSRWTKGAGVVKSLHPFAKFDGKHRNFIELHLAKTAATNVKFNTELQHVFTSSYLTHKAVSGFIVNNNKNSNAVVSEGKVIGLRLIPMERDLRFMWEEVSQKMLDEQAQKVQQSVRSALINWARTNGEGEDYRDNLSAQCIHPVGHWYEIPNLFLNGTLQQLIHENPNLKHIMIHNIDTLGANADPAILGYHISQGAGMSIEVISRKLDDRGGGLAKINGHLRLVEGLALPDEKQEFKLSYYNSNTFWINIDYLLKVFGLNRTDLLNKTLVEQQVYKMAARMPSYVIIKDVKKRWGKGQEDIFPVTQFEKLWGDMTSLPELACSYIHVERNRGQQLKEVAQLDGWLRDGSKDYIDSICKF